MQAVGSAAVGGSAAAGAVQHKKRHWSQILFIIAMVITIACVLFLVLGQVQSGNIKTGTIVQATTTGNPAMITTAFVGLRGEDALNISHQDQANMDRCDVPGAIGGLHSGWTSNGGVAWADPANVAFCSQLDRFPFDGTTCSVDTDCLKLQHMPCGSSAPYWSSNAEGPFTPWDGQCGMAHFSDGTLSNGNNASGTRITYCSFSDATSATGVCTINANSNFSQTCTPSRTCHWSASSLPNGYATSPDALCPFATCTSQNNGATGLPASGDCFEGQICSYSSAWSGGYCMGQPLPHVMINVPIVIEGTVSGENDDGTVNVYWSHANVAYDAQGPAKGWNYQDCVVTPSVDPLNQQARAILFGQGGSWTENMSLSDPKGFTPFVSQAKYSMSWLGPNMGGNLQQVDAVMPINAAIVTPFSSNTTYSAWNVKSNNLAKTDLMRIPFHSIKPNAVTSDRTSRWASNFAIGSASWLHPLSQGINPWQ